MNPRTIRSACAPAESRSGPWRRLAVLFARKRRWTIAALVVVQGLLPVVLPGTFATWLYAQQALPATIDPSVPQDLAVRLDEGLAAADALRAGGQLAAARERYDVVIRDAQAAGARRHQAAALWGRGRVLGLESNRAAAKASHAEALALYRTLGDREGEALTSRYLGLNLYHLGEYVASRAALDRAVALYQELGDVKGLAVAYNNLIYLLESGPEKDLVRDRALQYAREAGDQASACGVVHAWGDDLFDAGDFIAARPKLLEALRCYEDIDEPADVGRVLVSLGRVERAHGQYPTALDYYRRALALQQAAASDPHKADPTGAIQSLNAMAATYQTMGRHDEALAYYERALAGAQALKAENTITFLIGQLGSFYTTLGQYEKAVRMLESSLQYDQKPSHLSIRFGQLSEAYEGLGQLARAQAYAERAVETAPAFGQDMVIHSLYRRAGVARARGAFAAADRDLREAIRLIEDVRTKTIPMDFMKRGFSDLHQNAFAARIEMLSQQGLWEPALETAEQARARAFLDLLASRPAPSSQTSSPTPLVARAQTPPIDGTPPLRPPVGGSRRGADGEGSDPGSSAQVAVAGTAVAPTDSPPAVGVSSAGASTASASSASPSTDGASTDGASASGTRRAADATASPAAAPHRADIRDPALWDARSPRGGTATGVAESAASDEEEPQLRLDSSRSMPPADVATMIATAKRLQSTLLAYWVGRTGTFAWVVSPRGRVHATRIDIPASALDALVAQADQRMTGTAGAGFAMVGQSQTRPWRELYRHLIRPVRPHLPTSPGSLLTIVPHGPLFRVSFAALQDERGRYLVERYRLHYTPAIGVLQFTAQHQRGVPATPRQALLVGDPGPLSLEPGGDALSALPWARREVTEIAAQLPAGAPQVLIDAQASETDVRAKLEGADLLHFATHGVIQQQRPLSSYLALRPGGDDRSRGADAAGARGRDSTRAVARDTAASGATPGAARGAAVGTGSTDAASENTASGAPATREVGTRETARREAARRETGGRDTASDGRLTAEEVYTLTLRARLVVLSACSTALGPMTGDGVIGFTRAFLYAGASSVIATEWDVPDEAGYELMRRFYRARKIAARTRGGESDALRSAQLGVIDALRKGTLKVTTPGGEVTVPEHPLFWAGFVLVGEP